MNEAGLPTMVRTLLSKIEMDIYGNELRSNCASAVFDSHNITTLMRYCKSQAISLNFQSNVRVAGETIFGHVDINHTRAEEENIKEVLVKLIGRITT